MARRSPLLLLLLLPALALGALVWLDQNPRAPESAAGMVAARLELPKFVAELETATPPPAEVSNESATSLDRATRGADRRAGIAVRIEGRIAYAEGAVAGGSVLVLAGPNKTSWQWEGAARRTGAGLSSDAVVHGFANADGLFALDWTGDATELALVALAPTAATEAPLRWRAKDKLPMTLTLEPRAALFVDVRAGAGFRDSDPPNFRGAELRLRMQFPSDEDSELVSPVADARGDAARIPAARRNMTGWANEHGRASFLAISICRDFELSYTEHNAVPATQRVSILASGEQRNVVLPLAAGAHILGRVVDELGSPVANVKVRALLPDGHKRGRHPQPETETDGEGQFALRHVERTADSLGLSKEGFLEKNPVLALALSDGVRRDVGDLVLEHGTRFAGHVRYPDGSPAVGARLSAEASSIETDAWSALYTRISENNRTTADGQGHFTFSGLPDGFSFDLVARRDREGVRSIAHRDAVRDGEMDLELVLETAPAIVGRVLAPDGEPVSGALVRVVPQNDSRYLLRAEGLAGSARADPEGNFLLQLDKPEAVALEATASGFAPSLVQLVEAPNQDPVELQLRTPLTVTGRVVDTAGRPVVGATVERLDDSADSMRAAAPSRGSRASTTRTNSKGNFAFRGQPAGTLALRARHPEHAPSTDVVVELEYGLTASDVLLTLRRGAVVRGVLYRDGTPAGADAQVVASAGSSTVFETASTNGAGEFVFECLSPGTWEFWSMPSWDSPEEDGPEDPTELLNTMQSQTLLLEEGVEYTLELGAPFANPIAVHGVVRRAGEPASEGMVTFVAREAAATPQLVAGVDHAGHYEIALPGPGVYSVLVRDGPMDPFGSTLELRCEVPLVARHAFDIALPGGVIRGRVRGPDHRPMHNVLVSAAPDDGYALGTLTGGALGATVTDEDGRYELSTLGPGTYRVSAGGPTYFVVGPESLGFRVRTGIELAADQVREGIDFELTRSGQVLGQVRDSAGKPASSASVLVRERNGTPLPTFEYIETDAAGHFVVLGLAPGNYTFEARRGSLVSAESAAVTVRADTTAQVQLVLSQGAFLVLEVAGADPAHLAQGLVRVDVRDGRNRPAVGLHGPNHSGEAGGGSSAANEHRFGPLSPGSYRAVATGPGGARVERDVVLAAGEEQRLVLPLAD